MKLQPKWLIASALLAACTACSSVNTKQPATGAATTKSKALTLPMDEKSFVKAIENFDKKSIIAQLGEPAKADDVRVKGTDRIVASIWHYHNINTDESGQYFETTELDFIDDKVVQVVFLNNDGSEEMLDKEHAYKIPK